MVCSHFPSLIGVRIQKVTHWCIAIYNKIIIFIIISFYFRITKSFSVSNGFRLFSKYFKTLLENIWRQEQYTAGKFVSEIFKKSLNWILFYKLPNWQHGEVLFSPRDSCRLNCWQKQFYFLLLFHYLSLESSEKLRNLLE